jgi:predicted metalloprotease with PDZ domain
LNLFEFDYDLTFMVFFLNAEAKVYARYGGRDAVNADNRQSLAGLLYTMKSVLEMHQREEKTFAPRSQETTKFVRDIPGSAAFRRGCYHCHEVKEIAQSALQKAGKWTQDMVYRYPLPENLGFALEVDRGNVVRDVKESSAAALAGLKPGDVLQRLGGVPIHSFADAQFALDKAPRSGTIDVVWKRSNSIMEDKLPLKEGWRKGDVSWRPSLRYLVPYARLYGTDLTAEEKKALGLAPTQLAFRQKDNVPKQAEDAGIRPGDIIIGIDGKVLETNVDGFLRHVHSNYLIGDKATINILRDGKRLNLTMTFVP